MTKEYVYMLGFLWADGWVSKTKNQVAMQIKKDDGEVLKDLFQSCLPWRYYIYQKQTNLSSRVLEYSTFSITDLEFRNFLVGNDYCDKSSVSPDKILSKLSADSIPYFIRGFFDGDGSFYKGRVSFTGKEKEDWSWLTKIFDSVSISYRVDIKPKRHGKAGSASQLILLGVNEVSKFSEFINSPKVIGLERKAKALTDFKSARDVRKSLQLFDNNGNKISYYSVGDKIRAKVCVKGKYENFGYFKSLEDLEKITVRLQVSS